MRRVALVLLLLVCALPARAEDAWYPIKADDGSTIANHRVPTEIESEIATLPGIVTVGNPQGDVTLTEFYDLNCPYCRTAAKDIDALLRTRKDLKVILVPFPVLGVPSIEAGRVELAVAQLASADKFLAFHHKMFSGRGVNNGERALAVAVALGLDRNQLIVTANDGRTTNMMTEHVRVGDALGLTATPSYVIKGVAILGHPGGKALAGIVDAVARCDNVVCEKK